MTVAMGTASRRRRIPWEAIYWTLTVVGALYCGLVILGVIPYGGCEGSASPTCDAAAYYYAPSDPYAWELRPVGAAPYRYSPAFLIPFGPFGLLPWPVFSVVWFALHIAAFVWLRAGWMLVIPGLNDDVIRGNITAFLAVAVVLALTRSAAWWMPILLTKVTPGIGVLWHAVRREWRAFGIAVGITVAVMAVGYLIGPDRWIDWFNTLASGEETYEVGHPLGPLPLRLGVAALMIGYAGWSTRAWIVPLALVIAVPGFWLFNLVFLAAIPRLRDHRHMA